ncbi:MAG: hypothetical protein ACYTFT_11415, partial [Planctomycetota bacterium]
DRDESALDFDQRAHEFEIAPDGTETYTRKSTWSQELKGRYEELLKAGELRLGNKVFRRVRITRGEALDGSGFDHLLERMEELGRGYGVENVRVVVYFDR